MIYVCFLENFIFRSESSPFFSFVLQNKIFFVIRWIDPRYFIDPSTVSFSLLDGRNTEAAVRCHRNLDLR
ncbi:hypothetical protein LguiA_007507 [Lonicera macranthoides]